MNAREAGRIITFYSYKGGVGRSMTLANIAWILASNGKRVLIMDWDFEAPALHRYFRPFLIDKELSGSEGMIDCIINYLNEFAVHAAARSGQPEELRSALVDYQQYAFSLDWSFPGSGCLDFVPAGRLGASYAARVAGVNWQTFYERFAGGAFLEAVKRKLRLDYDYVLIDSRTGISDISAVAAVQMPDILAVCFTYNLQSLLGAEHVAGLAQTSRGGEEGEPKLRIFPIPARVESTEKALLFEMRERARRMFDPFLGHCPPHEREQYWASVAIPYSPYYAFWERLAVFVDHSSDRLSLLSAFERLAGYLSDGEVIRLNAPGEAERAAILQQYEEFV